jgi:hypothetical protein
MRLWNRNTSPATYIKATKVYFKHLLRLDFSGNQSLLKYFGSDFFHDALISSVNFDVLKQKLSVSIIRAEADREDINYFRKDIGLDMISKSSFDNNPIRYECEFYNTTGLNGVISCPWGNISIMDTEIEYSKKNNLFKITFSIEDKIEFWFTFTKSRISILSKKIIKHYTNGRKPTVPYCKQCKGRLLTKQKISDFINN